MSTPRHLPDSLIKYWDLFPLLGPSSFLIAGTGYPTLPSVSDLNQSQGPPYMDNADPCPFHRSIPTTANFSYLLLFLLRSTLSETWPPTLPDQSTGLYH